jgi:hypothetical protein
MIITIDNCKSGQMPANLQHRPRTLKRVHAENTIKRRAFDDFTTYISHIINKIYWLIV